VGVGDYVSHICEQFVLHDTGVIDRRPIAIVLGPAAGIIFATTLSVAFMVVFPLMEAFKFNKLAALRRIKIEMEMKVYAYELEQARCYFC
jgi:hypothetical protein